MGIKLQEDKGLYSNFGLWNHTNGQELA